MDFFNDLQIQVEKEADGSYFAEVKNLPGCFSAGETLLDLEKNLQEAIESYILSLQKDLKSQKIHLHSDTLSYA